MAPEYSPFCAILLVGTAKFKALMIADGEGEKWFSSYINRRPMVCDQTSMRYALGTPKPHTTIIVARARETVCIPSNRVIFTQLSQIRFKVELLSEDNLHVFDFPARAFAQELG